MKDNDDRDSLNRVLDSISRIDLGSGTDLGCGCIILSAGLVLFLLSLSDGINSLLKGLVR